MSCSRFFRARCLGWRERCRGRHFPTAKLAGWFVSASRSWAPLRALAVLPSDIGETASRLLGASFVVAGDSDIVGPQEDVRAWATELARLRTRVGDVLEGIDLAIPKQSDLTISGVCRSPRRLATLPPRARNCSSSSTTRSLALRASRYESRTSIPVRTGLSWLLTPRRACSSSQNFRHFHAHTIHRREDDRCVARLRAVRVAEAQLTSTQLSLDAARRELFRPQIKALAESSPGGKKSKAIRKTSPSL